MAMLQQSLFPSFIFLGSFPQVIQVPSSTYLYYVKSDGAFKRSSIWEVPMLPSASHGPGHAYRMLAPVTRVSMRLAVRTVGVSIQRYVRLEVSFPSAGVVAAAVGILSTARSSVKRLIGILVIVKTASHKPGAIAFRRKGQDESRWNNDQSYMIEVLALGGVHGECVWHTEFVEM
ncbi:hypothetical protein ARMGADRAFT_1033820 [Armillaria gallica]|uniref:Uncharacterized protein n=1 Tax=Armillaria gallica TaxID=47427 RepID=A0A2H3D0R1_ARMGA|nr:hypothetical protein ARMGADRAFT_1033820 [Armillaria gallica]